MRAVCDQPRLEAGATDATVIGLVLMVLAAADGGAGLPDGGEYVVLDVNHGDLWLNRPDGGVDTAPTFVLGGGYLDDDALMHSGQKAAFSRAALAVPPDVDTRTVLLVAALMFGIGVALGLVGGLWFSKLF